MAKRFPVLYPMPFSEDQYYYYLKLAEKPVKVDSYKDLAWNEILPSKKIVCTKHKDQGHKLPVSDCIYCNRYDYSMIEKTVSNLIATGFLYKDNKTISLPKHSLSYIKNKSETDFSELVLNSLIFALGKEDGDQIVVEAIIDILNKLPKNSEDFISQKDFRNNFLSENIDPINGYDLDNVNADRTLRELLKLLEFIEAAESNGKGKYKLNKSNEVDKIKNKFKKISYLNIAENTIDVLGSDHKALDADLIMTLSKYYIYRHSRGIGRQRELIKKLLKKMDNSHDILLREYKKDAKLYGFGASKGENIENTAKNYRNKLAREIAKNCNVNTQSKLFKHYLSRVKVSRLKKLEKCNSEAEIKAAIKRSRGRFDRSLLNEIMHNDGKFKFPNDFKFFSSWQKEAVDKWIRDDQKINHKAFSGIVSAVTGSGKTIMALLAIQEYIKKNPSAIVSIIVPTKVLMYQWAEELAKKLGLSSYEIGLRGDGFKDSFSEGKQVVLSIVNSAIRNNYLKKDIDSISNSTKHLLIADECHRYGGQEFNRVFDCRIDAKLGLSATPPADNKDIKQNKNQKDENEVINSIGSEFYQLNYNKARELDLICEFKIKYVALNLTPKQRIEYDALTKAIGKSLEKIRLIYGHRLDAMNLGSLHQKLQIILNNDETPDPSISKFFRLTKERRDIVNDSYERKSCFLHLIKNSLRGGENNKKIMIFHEKIKQLEEIISSDRRAKTSEIERETYLELQDILYRKYYRPVMYHSQQDQKWNSWAMDWFRKDFSNTMLSVKALVEGVDVPSADVGIVRVSSSSVRQRIQTIGRVLRKGRDKRAEIYVLFVKDTVDENIFRSYDWNVELGMSAIEYYEWDEFRKELINKDISEIPQPEDYEDNLPPLEVDVSNLSQGDLYPGRFAGDMYHVNADGKPYKRSRFGRIFINNEKMIEAAQAVKKLKGGGKLLVTPQGNIITNIQEKGTIFLGVTDCESVKKEIQIKREKIEKTKSKKRVFKKPPTFEELFGS